MYTDRDMMILGRLSLETDDSGTKLWWAGALPLGASGYGATREEACANLVAMLEELVQDIMPSRSFKARVVDDGQQALWVTSNDTARLIALLLREERAHSHLSLADVAKESGAKSRNAYAQYEQGKVMPTLSKLQEMLDIVAPDLVLAIIPRNVRMAIPDKEIEPELARMAADPSPENIAAWLDVARKEDAAKRDAHEKRRAATRAEGEKSKPKSRPRARVRRVARAAVTKRASRSRSIRPAARASRA